MAVSVSGTMTLSTNVSPIHDATTLTTLLGKAPEELTIAQFDYLRTALKRIQEGENPNKLIGTLLTPFV